MSLTLAVVMGGPAPEAGVSRDSGRAMSAALRERGHRVMEFELSSTLPGELTALQPDCVVLALHGVPGEDGSVQGLCEVLGLPYTGSGVTASAAAIDKVLTKRIAQALGIPVARDVVLRIADADVAATAIEAAGLAYPLIVKGSTGGSTLGLSKITGPEALTEALQQALAQSPAALIEECIEGIEITVCLLGNGTPQVLPTPQILSERALYDYTAKYTPGLSHHRFPPDCDPAWVQLAEANAVRLYETLGCAGCARVDTILTPIGVPMLLEVNTIPGMTAVSLLPDAAQRAGISFPALCDRLVQLALERSAASVR